MNLLMITAVFLCITKTESARILAMFPVPSHSHQVVFRPLTQELAKRGHEITIITPDPAFSKEQAPPNLTEIDVHDVSYKKKMKFFEFERGNPNSLTGQVKLIFEMSTAIVSEQFKVEEVKKAIEKDYDLLIIEAAVKMPLVLSHILKVPTIVISSFGSWGNNYQVMGAPEHLILYPTNSQQRLYNLNAVEKLYEIYNYFMVKYYEIEGIKADDEANRNIFGDVPSVAELQNNIDMLFLNEATIWADNRPVPPNVVYLGGLHTKPIQELPKDLKSYLDASKNGVIYFSFGTNTMTSHLPREVTEIFLKVFSQLPYDVLLKWDTDKLHNKPDNVKVAKWLPQSDILRHPKIKLFITQGGIQSTDEAIIAGVPMIGIPMLGDQWYNTEKYAKHGIGIQINMEALSEEVFKGAIYKVITDDSYRRNVIKLRDTIYDQPQRPLERAVWWVEYVLRHGGAKHLRSPAANISWAEYLEVELVGIVLGSLLGFTIVTFLIAYYLFKLIRKRLSVDVKIKSS